MIRTSRTRIVTRMTGPLKSETGRNVYVPFTRWHTTKTVPRSHLSYDAELPLDCNAVIYHGMLASNSGCKHLSLVGWCPGICMKILSARPRASTIGCWFVDEAPVQTERGHAIVAQLPDPSLWMPHPSGLLHPLADCHVGKGDA